MAAAEATSSSFAAATTTTLAAPGCATRATPSCCCSCRVLSLGDKFGLPPLLLLHPCHEPEHHSRLCSVPSPQQAEVPKAARNSNDICCRSGSCRSGCGANGGSCTGRLSMGAGCSGSTVMVVAAPVSGTMNTAMSVTRRRQRWPSLPCTPPPPLWPWLPSSMSATTTLADLRGAIRAAPPQHSPHVPFTSTPHSTAFFTCLPTHWLLCTTWHPAAWPDNGTQQDQAQPQGLR